MKAQASPSLSPSFISFILDDLVERNTLALIFHISQPQQPTHNPPALNPRPPTAPEPVPSLHAPEAQLEAPTPRDLPRVIRSAWCTPSQTTTEQLISFHFSPRSPHPHVPSQPPTSAPQPQQPNPHLSTPTPSLLASPIPNPLTPHPSSPPQKPSPSLPPLLPITATPTPLSNPPPTDFNNIRDLTPISTPHR